MFSFIIPLYEFRMGATFRRRRLYAQMVQWRLPHRNITRLVFFSRVFYDIGGAIRQLCFQHYHLMFFFCKLICEAGERWVNFPKRARRRIVWLREGSRFEPSLVQCRSDTKHDQLWTNVISIYQSLSTYDWNAQSVVTCSYISSSIDKFSYKHRLLIGRRSCFISCSLSSGTLIHNRASPCAPFLNYLLT